MLEVLLSRKRNLLVIVKRNIFTAYVFYIPKLARQTWERHECGIGIYSMQGFERRNKESKSIMNKFNNNKQHRIPQQLRRLWDIFYRPRKKIGRKKRKVAMTVATAVAMTVAMTVAMIIAVTTTVN